MSVRVALADDQAVRTPCATSSHMACTSASMARSRLMKATRSRILAKADRTASPARNSPARSSACINALTSPSNGWPSAPTAPETLRASACRRFTTVLGPGADSHHDGHIHVDLIRRHDGYRICEWDVREPPPTEVAGALIDGERVPLPPPRPAEAR